MNVGTRIRERRRMLHLTLDAASARAGMQASNLSDIESGKRDVRTKTLARIAIALNAILLIFMIMPMKRTRKSLQD